MYYAKIDRFTGEVFPCMDNSHHNGTLGKTDKASEIRYFQRINMMLTFFAVAGIPCWVQR